MRRSTRLACAVVAIAVAGSSFEARADHGVFPSNFGPALAAVGATVLVGLGGVITAVGNGISTAASPSRSWRIAGYAFAVLNLAAAVTIAAAAKFPENLALVLPVFSIGATNLGISIYGSYKADRLQSKVSLVPITGLGFARRRFAGVGIRIAAF